MGISQRVGLGAGVNNCSLCTAASREMSLRAVELRRWKNQPPYNP